MTDRVVFVGPSLRPEDRKHPSIRFLPPARQGDVLRCLHQAQPVAIGIIDGYFGTELAVHQKEILEAIAIGIPVLGAASMGALRASELSPYGMVGVGGIYREYQSGTLSSDADVAVTHAPAELGYVATTVALVDVRATLCTLDAELSNANLLELEAVAESLHFADRTLVAIAAKLGPRSFDALDLLQRHYVERKRIDALDLITSLASANLEKPRPIPPIPMTSEYLKIRSRALGACASELLQIRTQDHLG